MAPIFSFSCCWRRPHSGFGGMQQQSAACQTTMHATLDLQSESPYSKRVPEETDKGDLLMRALFVRALLGTKVAAGQVKNMQVEPVDYRKSSIQGGSTVSMSRIAETAAGPVYARTRSPVPARFASLDLER